MSDEANNKKEQITVAKRDGVGEYSIDVKPNIANETSSNFSIDLEPIISEANTSVQAGQPTSYLWFGGKIGWQVTSFDPRTDPAIGFPVSGDVRLYVEMSYARELENKNADLEAKLKERLVCPACGEEVDFDGKKMMAHDVRELEKQVADKDFEIGRLEKQIAELKWEYENVCKFATQYENQAVDLQAKLELAVTALEKINRLSMTDWQNNKGLLNER